MNKTNKTTHIHAHTWMTDRRTNRRTNRRTDRQTDDDDEHDDDDDEHDDDDDDDDGDEDDSGAVPRSSIKTLGSEKRIYEAPVPPLMRK